MRRYYLLLIIGEYKVNKYNYTVASRVRNQVELSGNQLAKRDRIIDAAVSVLLAHGVRSCTVRSIAMEAKTSKGIVHYYFSDVDEIIDAAMLKAVSLWIELISRDENLGNLDTQDGPVRNSKERFWRFISKSMEPFAHGDRTMMPLLLEYWAISTRRQRLDPLRKVQNGLVQFVSRLLASCDVDNSERIALAVTSYLIGVNMLEIVERVSESEILDSIALLTGLELPRQLETT